VERAVLVRRLLAVDRGGDGLSSLHVRIVAGLAGVTERTVWRWLAEGRDGRVEPRPRQGGFTMGDAWWEVLTQTGGTVAELRRRMVQAQDEGVLEEWGAQFVPSLATLHRAVKDGLRAGRVLQVARVASGWSRAGTTGRWPNWASPMRPVRRSWTDRMPERRIPLQIPGKSSPAE
jgi:hypothetical protein